MAKRKRAYGFFLRFSLLLLLPWPAPAQPLPWPVTTFRYEASQGTEEDEEEGSLIPAYLRHTASLRVKEEFSRALEAALLLRYSRKDYFQSGTDYAYWLLAPEFILRRRPAWRLEGSLACKVTDYDPQASGSSLRDLVSLGSRLELGWDLTPRTEMTSSLRGAFDLVEDPQRSRQSYTLGVGLESRLGAERQWLLGVRYSGTSRFPVGPQSVGEQSYYHLGAFSLSWDPNP